MKFMTSSESHTHTLFFVIYVVSYVDIFNFFFQIFTIGTVL